MGNKGYLYRNYYPGRNVYGFRLSRICIGLWLWILILFGHRIIKIKKPPGQAGF
jgi:hypothetical protein